MRRSRRGASLAVLAVLLAVPAGGGPPDTKAGTKAVEEAVLAVTAEMARAGEALDADRLFAYMLETDKVSVIQNGEVLVTRQEALERVRGNLRGIGGIRYRWSRQFVTVLSPDAAMLAAEGQSVVTTASGETVTAPFAQTVVFVRKADGWKAIHAHQSSPRAR